jgi:hypothetical protein
VDGAETHVLERSSYAKMRATRDNPSAGISEISTPDHDPLTGLPGAIATDATLAH